MKTIDKRSIGLTLATLLTGLLIGGVVYKSFIQDRYIVALNVTKSLPDYFYLIDTHTKDIHNNDVVAFSFMQRNDRYYDFKHNFIKRVLCKPGDTLSTKDTSYKCNGRFIGIARKVDSQGRSVQQFIFNGEIPKDKYFVMGSAYNSYDSRYWGFVDKKDILGVALW